MKTITLSDVDVQTIVDALRFKHAILINALTTLPEQDILQEAPPKPPVASPSAKYGVKKDGTPRKPPGRPRSKR